MLNVDLFRVSVAFSILAFLCLAANEAFRFLRSSCIPRTTTESSNVAGVMAHTLPLCIGILAILVLLIPPSLGLLALSAVLLAVVIIGRVRSKTRGRGEPLSRQDVRNALRVLGSQPIPLALSLVSFVYIGWALVSMRWPPPGDIMSLHGSVTLYLATGGYPGLVENLGYYYPPGFHILPAAMVGPIGLYPAEAVFVFGAFIAALVPPMMYGIAKQLGAPTVLAFLAFSSAFVVHPSDNLERWILGPFFNGPYPNLLGYLVILLLVALQVDRGTQWSATERLRRYAGPALFYSAILLFVYPSFAILVLLHLALLWIIIRARSQRSVRGASAKRSRRANLRAIVGIATLAAIATGLGLRPEILNSVWTLYATPSSDYLAYQLSPTFLYDNITGMLILVGIAISVHHVLNRRQLMMGSFYLVTASLVLLSLHPVMYSLLWPILPSRSVLILGMITWPWVLAEIVPTIRRLLGWIAEGRHRSSSPRAPARARPASIQVVGIFLVLGAAQALTYPPVTAFNAPAHYGWFSSSPEFSDDFGAIEWVAFHVGPNDIVLSDGSYISRYAVSMAFVRLSHAPPHESNSTLFAALNQVWEDPANATYVVQALRTHNVQYRAKPFEPATYARVFDGYSFLRIEYRSGNSRVYLVDQSAL